MKTYFITSNVSFNCIIKAPDPNIAIELGKLISKIKFGFVVDGIDAELLDDYLDDYEYYFLSEDIINE